MTHRTTIVLPIHDHIIYYHIRRVYLDRYVYISVLMFTHSVPQQDRTAKINNYKFIFNNINHYINETHQVLRACRILTRLNDEADEAKLQ